MLLLFTNAELYHNWILSLQLVLYRILIMQQIQITPTYKIQLYTNSFAKIAHPPLGHQMLPLSCYINQTNKIWNTGFYMALGQKILRYLKVEGRNSHNHVVADNFDSSTQQTHKSFFRPLNQNEEEYSGL